MKFVKNVKKNVIAGGLALSILMSGALGVSAATMQELDKEIMDNYSNMKKDQYEQLLQEVNKLSDYKERNTLRLKLDAIKKYQGLKDYDINDYVIDDSYGYIKGHKAMFRPQDHITRAEVAAILERVISSGVQKEKVVIQEDDKEIENLSDINTAEVLRKTYFKLNEDNELELVNDSKYEELDLSELESLENVLFFKVDKDGAIKNVNNPEFLKKAPNLLEIIKDKVEVHKNENGELELISDGSIFKFVEAKDVEEVSYFTSHYQEVEANSKKAVKGVNDNGIIKSIKKIIPKPIKKLIGLDKKEEGKKINPKEEGFGITDINDPFKEVRDVLGVSSEREEPMTEEPFSNKSKEFITIVRDVDKDKWYADAVYYTIDNGLLKGKTKDGMFFPEDKITRAELATIVNRVKGREDNATEFKDVSKDKWYYEDVVFSGFKGFNGNFKPNDYVTRAEAVTMINSILKDNVEMKEKPLNRFIDVKPQNWYYKEVEKAANISLR